MLLRPGQPQRDKSLEALGAGIASGLPHEAQCRNHPGPVGRAACLWVRLGLLGYWTIEQPDGVFPMVSTYLAELVEDQGSEILGDFAVAGVDGFEIFPFGLLTHNDVTLPCC